VRASVRVRACKRAHVHMYGNVATGSERNWVKFQIHLSLVGMQPLSLVLCFAFQKLLKSVLPHVNRKRCNKSSQPHCANRMCLLYTIDMLINTAAAFSIYKMHRYLITIGESQVVQRHGFLKCRPKQKCKTVKTTDISVVTDIWSMYVA